MDGSLEWASAAEQVYKEKPFELSRLSVGIPVALNFRIS